MCSNSPLQGCMHGRTSPPRFAVWKCRGNDNKIGQCDRKYAVGCAVCCVLWLWQAGWQVGRLAGLQAGNDREVLTISRLHSNQCNDTQQNARWNDLVRRK